MSHQQPAGLPVSEYFHALHDFDVTQSGGEGPPPADSLLPLLLNYKYTLITPHRDEEESRAGLPSLPISSGLCLRSSSRSSSPFSDVPHSPSEHELPPRVGLHPDSSGRFLCDATLRFPLISASHASMHPANHWWSELFEVRPAFHYSMVFRPLSARICSF